MQIVIDNWRIDVQTREARRGDTARQLSPRAVRLLQVLADAEGALMSRADLLDQVWPNVFVSDESLTQVVAELRRKLENKSLIATVARGGYRLTVPAEINADHDRGPSPTISSAPNLDAYVLCIEARECFARAYEGVHRTFVDLSAKAAELAPDYAEARALHATALFKRHIYLSEGAMLLDKTLEEAGAAIALDPSLASAHFIDGSARISIGWTETGLRSVETALSLAPDDPALHQDAAILMLTLGNKSAAAALATKALHLAPDQFAADLLLSRIQTQSEPHRARVHAKRALKKVQDELSLDPYSMRALYALGPLLAQLGDYRGAQAALEGVTHHNSPLEYYRAVGFAQIGDISSALERLDFLAMRGWRHACILDKDDGFLPMLPDQRFQKLHRELMAA